MSDLNRTRTMQPGGSEAAAEARAEQPAPDATLRLGHRSLEGRLAPGRGADERFEVTGMLGVGATGEVFAVYDRDLQRQVAVKLLRERPGPRGEGLVDFLAEARVTAALQHPNVLPILDIDLAVDGRPCFTMGRIDGITLGNVIEASTPAERHAKIRSPNAVVTMFIAVCHAIAYAHARGIVHQDLKPDNILLGEFGEVLVLDWGSAGRTGDDGRVTTRIYGTPLFMSPEQARSSHSERRSDIYSLGATLFHALALRPPTWDDDGDRFWAKKREGVIDPLTAVERRAVPAPLLSIAMAAMHPDPAARYAEVGAMAADLERYQAGLAVSVHRDPPWVVLRRFYAANRRLCWSMAAALALLLAMGVVLANEKAKESSAWTLVAEEPFDASAAERWRGVAKVWSEVRTRDVSIEEEVYFKREPGALVLGTHSGYIDCAYRWPLLGDLRVEWDYTGLVTGTNLNCFIQGDDRDSGYTFHIGGWDEPVSVVLTRGRHHEILHRRNLEAPLQAGRTYRFRMETEGDAVRLAIDGATVAEFNDLDSDAPATGTFGFDAIGASPSRVAKVRIWNKPLAQRITPIVYARKLLQLKQHAQAYAQFADTFAAHGDSELGPQALFGMAVSALRLERTALAVAHLDDFERRYPGHPLTPYCLRERLVTLPPETSTAEFGRQIARFAAYRGHPAARAAAVHLSESRYAWACPWQSMRSPDAVALPLDVVERIRAETAHMRAWLDTLGVPIDQTTWVPRTAGTLEALGRNDVTIELYPDQPKALAHALQLTGRFYEVLAIGGVGAEPSANALLALGRLDELIDGPYPLMQRRHAAIARDGAQSALARFPGDPELLLLLNRPDEAIAAAPGDVLIKARALANAGRFAEALAIAPTAWLRNMLLVQLRRYEVALADFDDDGGRPGLCVLTMLYHGDESAARALLERVVRHPLPMLGAEGQAFIRFLLPALLASRDGEAIDPGAALREMIDQHRWLDGQRPWHQASFIAGRIDETAFLAQPYHLGVATRLRFAQGLRHELARRWPEAMAVYAAVDASTGPAGLNEAESRYLGWRLRDLERALARGAVSGGPSRGADPHR